LAIVLAVVNQGEEPAGAATRTAMQDRLSRLCDTQSVRLVWTERNHGVSGPEPTIGPDLPERVEQLRAALPDADRARFEQDLTRR
jgi:hypothetical protein